MKWVRAKDGAIFGVCKGLAKSLDLPVGMFRLVWILGLLFFGAGFWLYLLLAISLPREDKVVEALDPRLLGVCTKLALKMDIEVGVVRFLTILLSLSSFGATIIAYVVLYFVLEDKAKSQSSDNKPMTPPAIT